METTLFIIVGAFILLDFITGIIKALKTKSFTSTIMRQGLYHKLGFILCVAFGVLADYGQQYIDIGVTLPVTKAVCTYICICEIGSIIENLGTINESLTPKWLRSFFAKLNERNVDTK